MIEHVPNFVVLLLRGNSPILPPGVKKIALARGENQCETRTKMADRRRRRRHSATSDSENSEDETPQSIESSPRRPRDSECVSSKFPKECVVYFLKKLAGTFKYLVKKKKRKKKKTRSPDQCLCRTVQWLW